MMSIEEYNTVLTYDSTSSREKAAAGVANVPSQEAAKVQLAIYETAKKNSWKPMAQYYQRQGVKYDAGERSHDAKVAGKSSYRTRQLKRRKI